MGSLATKFREEGSKVSPSTHPRSPEWITVHSRACNLAVVEVERLWMRFQQLGCTENGVLPRQAIERLNLKDDLLATNVLKSLQTAYSENEMITFHAFLLMNLWVVECCDVEKFKFDALLRAIFTLFNNSDPVDKDTLITVLRSVYPHEDEKEVKRSAETFMLFLDPENTGYIEQDAFVSWGKNLPVETLQNIFIYHIIPPEVLDRANLEFERENPHNTNRGGPTPSPRAPSTRPSLSEQPTDSVLQQVADKASRRDWRLLLNSLNYTDDEVSEYQQRYSHDRTEMIYKMLINWRNKDSKTTSDLHNVLRSCGMGDFISVLM
ncbi:DgyrCDS13999 [Dimorphilus gyrociliatus]|uniref:DgyrCDS13999 n=1 Tax=Dimorphilus gyrociliatus TaxID=2664684 RepID=A0A7I8WC83_9ANNE|nr:DgyrCDS13999 [Dimorphilus gyrociliatus]